MSITGYENRTTGFYGRLKKTEVRDLLAKSIYFMTKDIISNVRVECCTELGNRAANQQEYRDCERTSFRANRQTPGPINSNKVQ